MDIRKIASKFVPAEYIENFKEHPVAQLIHVGVGVLAAWLIFTGIIALMIAGALLIATVWKRQDLEFQARQDTPGIDLAYTMTGFIGICIWKGWMYF